MNVSAGKRSRSRVKLFHALRRKEIEGASIIPTVEYVCVKHLKKQPNSNFVTLTF